MRGRTALVATSLLALLSAGASWGADFSEAQRQLISQYPPAKATADGTDLVAAGAVVVLQKDNLMMCPVDLPYPTSNFYKNGAITQGALGGLIKFTNALNKAGGNQGGGKPMRTFVAGEKFFVTNVATSYDGVVLTFMSDPINDQRYKASLKFAAAKGATPTPEDFVNMVAEVLKVDASDAPAQQAAAAPPQPTKTISIGQSRDQVVATFGVPTKTVNLGAKEIDFFADMKVTFLNNKVTNVE